ncbi:hypothetical protein LWC34_00080 [Kibdelosporangium philippinense]|uniref:Uncharacterized protein n=2 Tax=Kibdelosporangium philippinense TaxID=211113 RepID=A0ABS8Z0I7_9PSEU|nr:hypothetical protein [Kibdelosporangium philippinense]MCE7001245.1 hypothetical protein [Kibdelosporangium philippinense]
MAAFAWHDPVVAVFAAAPVLIWCLGVARSKQTGLVIGVIQVLIAAWVLVPRALGISGSAVPSILEVCLFLPLVSVLIWIVGVRQERSNVVAPVFGFAALFVAGVLMTGVVVLDYAEGNTGAEGVWPPGPSGLRMVELEPGCGSGGCTRTVEATGDHAAQRMHDFLDSRGFTTPSEYKDWMCRHTGIVLTYKVCAVVEEKSPTTAHLSWSI